jgi:hypothetical protein
MKRCPQCNKQTTDPIPQGFKANPGLKLANAFSVSDDRTRPAVGRALSEYFSVINDPTRLQSAVPIFSGESQASSSDSGA